MKKDLDKLFSKSIQTYYFLLLIIVIIKVLGGNYFEIVYTNKVINTINNFIATWKLENIWYAVTLYINVYITLSISCNDNSKRMKKYSMIALSIAIILQILKANINLPVLFVCIDMMYLFLLSLIYLKLYSKITKTNIKNYWTYMMILNIVQLLSVFIRNVPIQKEINFIIGMILNLDYILMLIILYKLYFYKGGVSLWDTVVSYGLQKLTSLKSLLRKLLVKFQTKTKRKKTKSKEEKITQFIYIPLYILWNLFTMSIIVLIAFLNDAFVEAIFITVAFWVNKFAFGKPFHFKSVAVCFVFSSITYYVLTRITFSTETSFFIPIFLGVALSYVTSHFIKKNTTLYKGMNEEELTETIKQVEDNILTIKILKEYYCDRLDDREVASRNHYSVDNIRKIRQRVNKKLKNL